MTAAPEKTVTMENMGNPLLKQALACLERNDNAAAQALFAKVVQADRANAEAWYYLGVALVRLERLDEAEHCLGEAVRLRPRFEQAHYWLGITRNYLNKPRPALESLRAAIKLNAGNVGAYVQAGRLHQACAELAEAERCFRAAIRLKPETTAAHVGLAETLYHQGHYEPALETYRRALALDPGNVKAAMGFHLSLPIVYRDNDDLFRARARYAQGLRQLHAGIETFRSRQGLVNELMWSNGFYLAYQGQNDRLLQAEFAAFFQALAASGLPQFVQPPPKAAVAGRRIRIGYVCHFLHQHTVSHYFRAWIENADRDRFETAVFHLDPRPDAVSAAIAACCDRYIPITGSVSVVAQAIRAADLDVLVYLEVGMHPRHALLASLRLAPVQCAAFGHPVTTGLPTIDYYLSAEATEPDDADAHYTERLVRLPGMGVEYARPEIPAPRPRADFGLPDDRTLYLCSQSAFKIHPDTDGLLASVAARDPDALVLLFEDGRAPVDAIVRERLARTFRTAGADVDRQLRVMRRLGYADYLALNQAADVMLDTLHWSGGRTSFDALACGLPVVTLPGAQSRGRQTYGMLKLLDLPELIAGDTRDYVERAVGLGSDSARRSELSRRIRERANARLFEGAAALEALASFYERVARA